VNAKKTSTRVFSFMKKDFMTRQKGTNRVG